MGQHIACQSGAGAGIHRGNMRIITFLSILNFVNCYYPSGPQENVRVSRLINSGWRKCYQEDYGTPMKLDQIQSSCQGEKVILACRPKSDEIITLLAAAPRDVLVTTTDTEMGQNRGRISNGSRWYLLIHSYDEAISSIGFANSVDTLNLGWVDDGETSGGSTRLSWDLQSTGGGWRCGTSKYLNNKWVMGNEWEKIIFTRGYRGLHEDLKIQMV